MTIFGVPWIPNGALLARADAALPVRPEVEDGLTNERLRRLESPYPVLQSARRHAVWISTRPPVAQRAVTSCAAASAAEKHPRRQTRG
ncbi:hypothetical protein [Actinacidiphila glaucinigra]|uniref:hypothetical protein n=1 Tax=Actinacidiphila glaucinigra TaxID=235986 RepID=UPI003D8EA79F